MKHILFKLLTLTLITLVLSACGTLRQSFRSEAVTVVTPPHIVYPTIPLDSQVTFPMEILAVQERTVRPPPTALYERAHIVMSAAEVKCLADVIYFESKSEPEIGQIGVGYVVLNRMGHPQYPKTACGVAYDRKHGCQFDWACKGRVSAARHARLYEASRKVAMDIMEGRVANPVGDSTQFRQARLRAPRGMARTATLHGHSFYAAL